MDRMVNASSALRFGSEDQWRVQDANRHQLLRVRVWSFLASLLIPGAQSDKQYMLTYEKIDMAWSTLLID